MSQVLLPRTGQIVDCSNHLIHCPGAIQDHGHLIVIQTANWAVHALSRNLLLRLNQTDDIFGSSLSHLLTLDSISQVQSLARANKLLSSSGDLSPPFDVQLIHKDGQLLSKMGRLGKCGQGLLLLDLLPWMPSRIALGSMTNTLGSLQALQLPSFLDEAVKVFREALGYDRAFIFQFDSEFHSQIRAEDVNEDVTEIKYRGCIFPESDIPSNARKLYQRTRLQIIHSVDALTNPLLSLHEESFDLSFSCLRAISPTHIEYLQQMGVKASMSLALMIKGELWGMISFHHYSPRSLSLLDLEKLLSLSVTLSSLIDSLELQETSRSQQFLSDVVLRDIPTRPIIINDTSQKSDETHSYFYSHATAEHADEAIKLLLKDLSLIRSIFTADFAIINIAHRATFLDVVPAHINEVKRIHTWLNDWKPKEILTSHCCQKDYGEDPKTKGVFEHVAGLLHIPFSDDGSNFTVFLRLEHVQTLRWGGNPEHPFRIDPTSGKIHPRTSFQIYTQMLYGRSDPWQPPHLIFAKLLQRLYGKFSTVWSEAEKAANLDRLKNMMIASVSHEIRTPLHAILNFLEMAIENKADPGTEDYLQQCRDAGYRLLGTINDLLDLTRMDAGKAQINFSHIRIQYSLSRSIDLLRHGIGAKGLDLHVEFGPGMDESTRVLADEGKLWQVMTNLLGNAAKYTERGSIKISACITPSSISDHTLILVIKDTGIGIPQSRLPTIFMPFERVQNSDATQSPVEGTGIGLAIVARLVKVMGGTMEVVSQERVGSTFTVSVPVKCLASETDDEMIEKGIPYIKINEESRGRVIPFAILVAEDNPVNQQIIEKRLNTDGHTVTLTSNGLQCFKAYEATVIKHLKEGSDAPVVGDYDLIIMDIQVRAFKIFITKMPIMDGLGSTSRIRQFESSLSPSLHVPILACSAHSYKEDILECQKAGCDGYILKPIRFQELKCMLLDIWTWKESGKRPERHGDAYGWF